MGLLDRAEVYGENKWEVVQTEKLSKEDQGEIDYIEVTSRKADWGVSTSLCFHLKSGGMKFIPVSSTETKLLKNVGERVDKSTVELLLLEDANGDTCVKATGVLE